MQSIQKGTLVAGQGLQGDRYSTHHGTYSTLHISKQKPGEREPGRQLTMMSADGVQAAFARQGLKPPASLGDLRRNIVVSGICSKDLLGAVGSVIQLGEQCLIFVCVPCMYNERKNCIPDMMEAIWNESGVACEVLLGGPIVVGDKVTILEKPPSEFIDKQVDDGQQPAGYNVPPSKRTMAMVMEAMATMREVKKLLSDIVQEGAKRVQESYASVGLTFWPKDKE